MLAFYLRLLPEVSADMSAFLIRFVRLLRLAGHKVWKRGVGLPLPGYSDVFVLALLLLSCGAAYAETEMEIPATALWQILVLCLAGAIAWILRSIDRSLQGLRSDILKTNTQLVHLDRRVIVLEQLIGLREHKEHFDDPGV